MVAFQAGTYRKQDGYQCFTPATLNQEYSWDDARITSALADAMHALGELNAASETAPSLATFLEMYITKEAVTSSHIEGTKTNVEEVFLPEEEVQEERRNDLQEVRNYIAAIHWCTQELDGIPLSMRLIKGAHKKLMEGARGQNKQPGEVRMSQNWIGGPTPDKARFVPPSFIDVPDLLTDMERFVHNKELNMPQLIKAALIHYQFETIHPFLDGNGRTGRMLITLYLMHEKLLTHPTLYLSAYFDAHRDDYFDALNQARTKNDIDFWILFFLAGVAETSRDARSTLRRVMELKAGYESLIADSFGRRTDIALKLLQQLFADPIVQIKDVMKELGISKPSANSLVKEFVDTGMLKETTGQKKDRIFSLHEYVALFDSIT